MKQISLSPRAVQLRKYNSARMNLFLVVIVTLINVILGFTGSGTYFLFSAFIPYFLVISGMYNCGKMPADWYEGDMSEYDFLEPSYLVILATFALIILTLYVIFFLLSKNQKSGWLIAALVLFSLDTVGFLLLGSIGLETILDLLFHAWVLYYLISGVIAAKKLKFLPPDEEEIETEKEGVNYFPETVSLKKGKQIKKVAANYFRGSESVGGALYFYNDRIIFKSHSFNIQVGNTTLRYANMTSTEAQKNLGISNGLLIYTADGTAHRFVVQHRDDIMEYINKKILSFQNQQ